MMRVFVQSVGILGPGLPGWTLSRSILAGRMPYQSQELPHRLPEILPPTERRRSSETARLAVSVAEEAMSTSGFLAEAAATVFVSSDGDGQITHEICEALASPQRDVSPTRFHNSVYNAPAGYWSIATRSRFGSISLCAFDLSFAAGLLEAASQTVMEQLPVLLIAFDLPMPPPLHALRPVGQGFAAALLLTHAATPTSLACWEVGLERGKSPSAMPGMVRDSLGDNPAARCLPLLHVLARESTDSETIWLDYLGDQCVAVQCQR
jgi:beta-ketoacyl synthase-like protein